MKSAQKSILRIKDMLKRDKESIPVPLINLIKNDLFNTLNNYLDIYPEDINLSYYVNNDSMYHIEISLESNRIKKVNFLNI